MNRLRSFLSLWLCAAGLVLVMAHGAFAAEPAAPQILTVRTVGTNLVVTVQIPKRGLQAVILESRALPDTGAWVPRAVARSGLSSGKIRFRVPLFLQGQTLRARGQMQEARPKSFYRGKHTFARQGSSFWRPDQGRGEVFSLAANGSLPSMGASTVSATTTRTVVESDIWKISGDTLYFFNQLRGLQVIDISNPDTPALKGTLDLPAVGEQMYLLDPQHVVLLAGDNCSRDGKSQLVIVDVSANAPRTVAMLPIEGWVQESRLVGTALYVASEGYQLLAGTNPDEWQWGTVVTSFDLSNPANPVVRSRLWFAGLGNAITATDRRLFVATLDYAGDGQPVVRVLDSSAPDGTLSELAAIRTAGRVADKFKMNLAGDIFSVISENFGSGSTAVWGTTLETFSLANPGAPAPLGHLQLASGERLFATRFDSNRVYVVTFHRVDPLWVIDLSNPAQPVVAGSVQVPGWSTYIQPLGDRLVTIGMETNRVAVSLFDVHDPAQPVLLGRVPLGENYSWSEANHDEKAFAVLPELGLIMVPYEGNTADGWASRVQLIDLGADSLAARGVIEHRFAPRRAAAHAARVLSLSGRDLLSVDIANRDQPVVISDTELAWPVNRVFVKGDYIIELATGAGWSQDAQAAVRIAPAAQPNTVANRLDLGDLAIVGAALRNDRLFVLQSPNASFGGPFMFVSGGFVPPVDTPTNLVMTVLDVSALPAISILGQTAISSETAAGGTFDAIWPSPDLLVWFSSGFGIWFNPLVGGAPVGMLAAAGAASPPAQVSSSTYPQLSTVNSQPLLANPYWRPWWGGGGARLLALNVRDPAIPQLISTVNVNPTNAWGFSRPFTAQGLIYFSHQQSDYVTISAHARSGQSSMDWRVSEWLDVIDYADPANPTIHPSVSVPGELAGLSEDGAMLVLLGAASPGSAVPVNNREALNACAFDGVAAYLVDSLVLPQTWPRPVLVNHSRTYLGRAAANGATNNTLEAWDLSSKGRFVRLAVASVDQPVPALAIFGDLLAAQDGTAAVSLFDVSTPSALRLCGQGAPAGCLWFDLNRAAGALNSGLWIPLDDYGVTFVPVTALPANH
jgi:hypothetical protein